LAKFQKGYYNDDQTTLSTDPAHLEYMIAVKHKIIFGGPFRSDDMAETLGSLIVMDMPNREAVNIFLQDEPYFKNGVFESVIVRAIDIMIPERNPNFLAQELDREKHRKGI